MKNVKPIAGTVLKSFDNDSSKIYEIPCLAKNKDGQKLDALDIKIMLT